MKPLIIVVIFNFLRWQKYINFPSIHMHDTTYTNPWRCSSKRHDLAEQVVAASKQNQLSTRQRVKNISSATFSNACTQILYPNISVKSCAISAVKNLWWLAWLQFVCNPYGYSHEKEDNEDCVITLFYTIVICENKFHIWNCSMSPPEMMKGRWKLFGKNLRNMSVIRSLLPLWILKGMMAISRSLEASASGLCPWELW